MKDVLVRLLGFVIAFAIYCWRVGWDSFSERKSKIQNLLGDKKERWWE
jgi:hypothetical protein